VRIDRSDSRRLAFGAGAHRCTGSLLARTGLRILLDEWLPRIPDFWIKPGDRVEVKSGKVNAISRLPLTWQWRRTITASSGRAPRGALGFRQTRTDPSWPWRGALRA